MNDVADRDALPADPPVPDPLVVELDAAVVDDPELGAGALVDDEVLVLLPHAETIRPLATTMAATARVLLSFFNAGSPCERSPATALPETGPGASELRTDVQER